MISVRWWEVHSSRIRVCLIDAQINQDYAPRQLGGGTARILQRLLYGLWEGGGSPSPLTRTRSSLAPPRLFPSVVRYSAAINYKCKCGHQSNCNPSAVRYISTSFSALSPAIPRPCPPKWGPLFDADAAAEQGESRQSWRGVSSAVS